ncbi:MAG TPA: VWA domain-containing protein [Nitrososphaeraceae archaeon]|nr:VWA domain-containing protein [Nitrososphaeraceae archaeon]
MYQHPKNSTGTKRFVYFSAEDNQDQNHIKSKDHDSQNIPNEMLEKLLQAIGRESLRERTPNLQQLEQILKDVISNEPEYSDNVKQGTKKRQTMETNDEDREDLGMPIVTQLIQRGYLKDSQKWLTSKGFISIGGKILNDIMKALKTGEFGLHETLSHGSGSLLIDTTRKYEIGNDIRLLNVPRSLLNTVQRMAKKPDQIKIPLDLEIDDLEEYETMQDIRIALVYCIDLSSTMRYSSMFGDMTRIEAAKRALWSLFLLNRKYFPSDSIYIVGFGALASKVAPQDIPYLQTFEPGSDFLHYTNYQAAFRLAKKILQKDGALNRRIVLITDGHPSACFIEDKKEQNKILSQRPYSHFYVPDKETIESVKDNKDLSLDTSSGQLVYLCYRYRQVDQYIGDRTIVEAKKCRSLGIEIDTIMISEEDSLLGYVNEMEKYVKGRSYYINPAVIDKVLLNDYLSNKKLTIHAG